MATYAFSGGVAAVLPYGTQESMAFSGTWVAGEHWSWEIATTVGDLTLGLGQLAGLQATCCMTLKQRVYLGLGTQFNFSELDDPTLWDIQNSGAGFIEYMSQYGSQDAVGALAALQGRLAVFARKSIQIWNVDANPANFSLVQTLDNIGTKAPESVKQIGDYDVLFLDDTGFRSLRAREVTLNAFVDDLGLPVDKIIQAVLAGYDYSGACAVVEPREKRYWCFVQDTIYVLSLFRSSKIAAWSTYLPTYLSLGTAIPGSPAGNIFFTVTEGSVYYWTKGVEAFELYNGTQTLSDSGFFTAQGDTIEIAPNDAGETNVGLVQPVSQESFTPEKFVVFDGIVYCRATNGLVFTYGGPIGTTYDNTQAIAELPWLDAKTPSTHKTAQGIDVAMTGAWVLSLGMDPYSGTLETVLTDGSTTAPDEGQDSSFDKGKIPYQSVGTHFKFRAVSSAASAEPALISSLVFKYKKGYIT